MKSTQKTSNSTAQGQTDPIVRKSNAEIGFRIKAGYLSFLARKLVNIMIWHAQELRNKQDEQGRWTIPITALIKDGGFASRDYDLLRSALDELQGVRVTRRTKGGGVTSEVMIPSYTLDNVAHVGNEQLEVGQKRRGGALHLWFMFPPELKSEILDPEQYTRLPIAIMAKLKTASGLALYEICQRYSTNPGGLTNRDTWENWWRVLSGATPDKVPPAYKYAKRDVFKKAAEEVSRLTNIEVELKEFKSGRSVRDLQFEVRIKNQNRMEKLPVPIDVDLLSRVTELGLKISTAERLVGKYSEATVRDTLELLRDRIQNPNLPPVKSHAAYFISALRGNYAAGDVKPTEAPKVVLPIETLTPDAEASNPDAELAIASFEALPLANRGHVLDNFAATLQEPFSSIYAKSGLDSTVIRRSLAIWLAKNQIGQFETPN